MFSTRVAVVSLFVLCASPTAAAPTALSSLSTAEIAKRTIPAVVQIRGTDAEGREIAGSGFFLDGSGLLLTNLHVVSDLRRASVRLANGDIFDRLVIRAFDERRDLALLKIPGFDLPFIECANSDSVQVGDRVALVGNPLDLQGSLTTGVVSGVRVLDEGYRVIQTDAAANPGNSGGPLIDEFGRAVGVLTFKARGAENLSFVVPINYARGMLADSGAFTLDEMRAKLVGVPLLQKAALLPTRWKSLASGFTKIVRMDGDHLYVETVLSEEQQKAGFFFLSELKKDSTRFVGVTRGRFPCAKKDFLTKVVLDYSWCTLEEPIEISLVTPTRIEGISQDYPQGDVVNCTTCSHSKKPTTKSFVWIPE